jgi:hypothetical protein
MRRLRRNKPAVTAQQLWQERKVFAELGLRYIAGYLAVIGSQPVFRSVRQGQDKYNCAAQQGVAAQRIQELEPAQPRQIQVQQDKKRAIMEAQNIALLQRLQCVKSIAKNGDFAENSIAVERPHDAFDVNIVILDDD